MRTLNQMLLKRIKVTPIPLFKDNYCFLLEDLVSQQVALVDPALKSALEKVKGLNLTTLLVTVMALT